MVNATLHQGIKHARFTYAAKAVSEEKKDALIPQ